MSKASDNRMEKTDNVEECAKLMETVFYNIIDRVKALREVRSIGVSGGNIFLPKPGEGDVDVFIYCSDIPPSESRQDVITKTSKTSGYRTDVFKGGFWGTGDLVIISGVEIWLMYFIEEETSAFIDSVLNGDYPDRLENYFYPVGRCAMLKDIRILYDKNDFLSSMKQKLSLYPGSLAVKMTRHHMTALEDTEDLIRAVERKDVLFYHFALDIALDHFLQALFSINKIYFPSRKRSLSYIAGFALKPDMCEQRLSQVTAMGGHAEGLKDSYEIWRKLTDELKNLTERLY
ncbi:MAG: hypothetical protein BWY11_00602 [Firmicutes bacterium ADurb.Bin182]|nr:MAG: hypothetical protein BWY11_00602 [Firmicutes bacterium ADurb.Bin182]